MYVERKENEMKDKDKAIDVAILDLYNNEPNQGMRCIKELITECDQKIPGQSVTYSVYETRYKAIVPGLEQHDIYISSGGPGSPFEGEGSVWEQKYFELIDQIWNFNQQNHDRKKYVFFICHSFQMMARFFNLAMIRKRNHQSFGILPVHKTALANTDSLLRDLPEPYYAADFRQFEVVNPDQKQLDSLQAKVLSIESKRKDPSLERALMAIRISEEFIGTQYHPEADPVSMLYHFKQPERKQQVVDEYGEDKYYEMIAHLEDSTNIMLTRRTILPRFLMNAIHKVRLANNLKGTFETENLLPTQPDIVASGQKLEETE
jgi:GMP synthase-like glutamine amidotransferase